MQKSLILASNSQRRKELLAQCNINFEVMAADIDETLEPSLKLADQVQLLALKKATHIYNQYNHRIVLAADTMVMYQDHWLGKPTNKQDAIRMLQLLSNSTHQVISGVAIITPESTYNFVDIASVTMRPLEQQEILDYVESGIPMDKAGAYGIQDVAGCFVSKIEGDYYTIVGLPLSKVIPILRKFGF